MGIIPRRILAIALIALASILLPVPASAQPAGTVNCGNGHYCPAGNVCLIRGQCGREIDHPPGATRTSRGGWCDPGFYESKTSAGTCIPSTYSECGNGACPPGTTCSPTKSCVGGPPARGPMCGGVRCAADRACSSARRCYNPLYYNDCGNGQLCTKAAACEHPKGCVYVDPERTRQIRFR